MPTLLLIVGLLGGIVLAAGARLLAGRSATRAAAAARKALRAEVQQVAVDKVVTPVRAELATLEQFRAALQQARVAMSDKPSATGQETVVPLRAAWWSPLLRGRIGLVVLRSRRSCCSIASTSWRPRPSSHSSR